MKKRTAIVTVCLFALVILGLGAGSLLLPDKSFSPEENRMLQQRPEITLSAMMNGTGEEEISDYIDDQMLFRNSWIRLRTAMKLAVGQREVNGVYMGKDGYLMERYTPQWVSRNEEQFRENLEAIRTFCENLPEGITPSVMAVPTTASVMDEDLPADADAFDEAALQTQAAEILADCNFVDLYGLFTGLDNRDGLYYRTDHHWTGEGALLAYETWSGHRLSGDWEVLSDDFLGTTYSKVLWNEKQTDTLRSFAIDGVSAEDCSVTADGTKLSGIYQNSFLQEKDKYSVFFGGNYGRLEMTTGTDNGRRLLIIKDSFANCFAPLAVADFEEITMVDLRYFSGSLSEYMEEEGITDVLFLYSMANLVEDSHIAGINRTTVIR